MVQVVSCLVTSMYQYNTLSTNFVMGLARLSASSVGLVATCNVHAVVYYEYTVSRRELNSVLMLLNEENFSIPCCLLFFWPGLLFL